MKRVKFVLFIAIAGLATACLSELVRDPVDPRIPEYSEEGRNTAGAYIDGHPWSSRRSLAFFFVFPSGISGNGDIYFYHFADSTEGCMMAFEYGDYDVGGISSRATIGFYLSDVQILKPRNLLQLDEQTIILDGETNFGQLFLSPGDRTAIMGPDSLHRGTGVLHFRNVSRVPNSDSIKVSGTFGFDITQGTVPHTVYSGRFDYVVSQSEIQEFWPY